ncbi:MAG: hypothetical protein ABRQ37_23510 [Candidatus Eremiobacterota bacterium]
MFYIVVCSKKNYIICKKNCIYADKTSRFLKKLEEKDILIFYLKRKGLITGIYKVINKMSSFNDVLFKDNAFQFKIGIKPIIELEEDRWLSIKALTDKLSIIKKKDLPPGVYLQSTVKNIPEEDYRVIVSEINKIKNLNT